MVIDITINDFSNPKKIQQVLYSVNKATVNTTVKPLPENTFAFYLLTFNFRAAVLDDIGKGALHFTEVPNAAKEQQDDQG
jgi:hypothetical protein